MLRRFSHRIIELHCTPFAGEADESHYAPRFVRAQLIRYRRRSSGTQKPYAASLARDGTGQPPARRNRACARNRGIRTVRSPGDGRTRGRACSEMFRTRWPASGPPFGTTRGSASFPDHGLRKAPRPSCLRGPGTVVPRAPELAGLEMGAPVPIFRRFRKTASFPTRVARHRSGD